MGWHLAGYAGSTSFFGLEALPRKPGSASSLEASDADEGTTAAIVTAYCLAAVLPLVVRRHPVAQLPRAASPVGIAFQASGLALRAWSMQTLCASYTRTLRTEDQQPVIKAGAYRVIRHPGYTGSLLAWTGFALASRCVPVAVITAGLLGRAYRQHIAAEEKLVRRDLPGYNGYSRRTKKVIPFIW